MTEESSSFFSTEFRRIFLAPLFLTLLAGGFVTYRDSLRALDEVNSRSVVNARDIARLEVQISDIAKSLKETREDNAAQSEAIRRLQDGAAK